MKKRVVIAIIISVALALALCACEVTINVSQADYDKLTSMLDSAYSGWTLTVSTTKGDVTLENKFVVTKETEQTKIDYTVEKLNELSMDSDSEFKTRYVGTATIVDGKITSINGDEVSVELEKLDKVGLTFKTDYFQNAKMTANAISADVKDPSGFLGVDVTCSDMKLVASFGEKFDYIRISYKTEDGSTVVYNYDFAA